MEAGRALGTGRLGHRKCGRSLASRHAPHLAQRTPCPYQQDPARPLIDNPSPVLTAAVRGALDVVAALRAHELGREAHQTRSAAEASRLALLALLVVLLAALLVELATLLVVELAALLLVLLLVVA